MKIRLGDNSYGEIIYTVEGNKIYRGYALEYTIEGNKIYRGYTLVYTIEGNKIYYANSYNVAFTICGNKIREGSSSWGSIKYTICN